MYSPCLPGPAAHNPDTGLGVTSLDRVVFTLIDRAVTPSTLAAFQWGGGGGGGGGKRRYLSFCGQFSVSPLPLEELALCRVVASLFADSLSYQSIYSYISAVRHLKITYELPDPALASFARLAFVLKGVKRAGPPKHRLAQITPEILRRIHWAWSQQPHHICFPWSRVHLIIHARAHIRYPTISCHTFDSSHSQV